MSDNLFSEAQALFERKEYHSARILFLSIASEDMNAQYYLGAIYRMGLGTFYDQKESFMWFLRAANKGHAESQFLVACAYTCNIFFICNETKLVVNDYERINRESKEDVSTWQDFLPYTDLNGIGVEKDEEKAYEWMLKAAYQNYVNAQIALGDMFDWGICAPKDKKEAVKWYTKAVHNQSTQAMHKLAFYSSYYEHDFTKSIELLLTSFYHGDIHSAYLLGIEFESLSETDKNIQETFKWYKVAATEGNNYRAQYELGVFYLEGKAVEVDIDFSILWFKKSIDTYKNQYYYGYFDEGYDKLYELKQLGYKETISNIDMIEYLKTSYHYNEKARITLREFYNNGYDVGDKLISRFELLSNAELGDKDALIKLGYLDVTSGIIDASIKDQAYEWYKISSINGNLDAQYLLAVIYYGYNSSDEKEYWLRKAADQGHIQAQYDLANIYKSKDKTLSLIYMKMASKSNIYAQIDLGYQYAHGDIVDIDYKEAYHLYQQAAENMMRVKDISELRFINYKKLRFNAANDTALKKAVQGNVNAQLYMGCLYQYGFEVKRNKSKSINWYKMAKSLGSNEAKEQLKLFEELHQTSI